MKCTIISNIMVFISSLQQCSMPADRDSYLPNGNFEKTGQGFSVKTGQNTGQNFRALPWMPSEVPTGCREKGCNFIDL